jgi:hypothetical protein
LNLHVWEKNQILLRKTSFTPTDLATMLRFYVSIVSQNLPEIVLAHEIHLSLFCEVEMGGVINFVME